MLQLTETYTSAAFEFIITLRRLNLAKAPVLQKTSTDEIFNVWTFAAKWGNYVIHK